VPRLHSDTSLPPPRRRAMPGDGYILNTVATDNAAMPPPGCRNVG